MTRGCAVTPRLALRSLLLASPARQDRVPAAPAARIADGQMEGGYTGAFELICGQCGDHPYLDYSQIPPPLQQIRWPYPLQAGVAAYENHLGPETGA